MDVPEYALELLLGYDGRRHYFASGHYLKFRCRIGARAMSGESRRLTTGTARRAIRAGRTNSFRWSAFWKIFSAKPSGF